MRYTFNYIIISFWVIISAGCYSFSNSTLPSHIKTIIIHPVDNQSLHATLGDNLTQAIQDMFTRNARSLRQVNKSAHSEINITIKRDTYKNEPFDFDSDGNVNSYRVQFTVDVVFRDISKDEIIYEGKDIVATGIYKLGTEDEIKHGQARAIEDLQEVIIGNSLSSW